VAKAKAKPQLENEIRRLRFEHDEMTQQALADAVGCSRQTIVMLEQNRYVPSLVLALKVAEIFELPVEDVFTLVELIGDVEDRQHHPEDQVHEVQE